MTAEIALVSYTILVFVRTRRRLRLVPPAARRRRSDGLHARSTTLKVELPWRCRASSPDSDRPVTIVGLVTITAIVGNGGYGAFINDGLSCRFSTPIVLGAGLSILLAVILDVTFALIGRGLQPWRRRSIVAEVIPDERPVTPSPS
ncbi:MAG: hypothetical protein R2715_19450 [Ilumatobacteraceae bacterium]